MGVGHGGLQGGMPERELDGPGVYSGFEQVGGIGVPQVVRSDGSVQADGASGIFDGPLDVGFVATPADGLACAGVTTGAVGREQPIPGASERMARVFLFQASGQWHGNGRLLVLFPLRGCDEHLGADWLCERARNGYHSVFTSFRAADKQPGIGEVDVFDPEIQRLVDPKAATIEEANNEADRLAGSVPDGREQPGHVFSRWGLPDVNGALGAEGVDFAEFLFQHFSVEKQDCVECLVLR